MIKLSEWTPKGKPKDGYYYDGECPKCGKVKVAYMGRVFVCPNCNNDHNRKVKITEKC